MGRCEGVSWIVCSSSYTREDPKVCSLCVAWIAVVSMDEGCRGPQQLKLHISAGLVRAVGDLLIASFSPMDYFHGQGDLSLSRH